MSIKQELISEYLEQQTARHHINLRKCLKSFNQSHRRVLDEGKHNVEILTFKMMHLLITYGENIKNNRAKTDLIFKITGQLTKIDFETWLSLLIPLASESKCIQNYKFELLSVIQSLKIS